ncbi:MAG TPA: ABC transporter ATP-binding protein [Stellaceae bacterium]|jgi:NitT/TauT family transport system ATP-binding protein|nr:ABC transporter ATP-binding protein [Stellaceae bacterium]
MSIVTHRRSMRTGAGAPVAGSRLLVDEIGKSFLGPDGGTIAAIGNVSLDVAPGEFLAIVGPSGCGKSTLLQVIAGLMLPSSGKVRLGEHDVTGEPAHMVYLFQQYSKSLLPWMTVANNVMFAFSHRLKLSSNAAAARCRDYLAMVGLADFAQHYPWQLSGGMQQRVAIARALAAEPQVLLMDEPFSSVDALTRLDLHALILDLWTEKRFTAVLVTHDVDEAIFLADRVAVLTQRPAMLSEVIETKLPRPRHAIETRESPAFLALRHRLLKYLLARNQDGAHG